MGTSILSGLWLGQYIYGGSYGIGIEGTSIDFEMNLRFDGHVITGICIDNETKHIYNDPATIEGVFDNNYISLIKKYPCYLHSTVDGKLQLVQDKPAIPIHYTGALRKKGLFFRNFFEGEWEITTSIQDEDGNIQYFTGLGNWRMKKH